MEKTQRVLLLCNPVESLNWKTDTSLLLALEAQSRGYTVYTAGGDDVFFRDGNVYARVRCLKIIDFESQDFQLQDLEVVLLVSYSLIFFRLNPPYDMSYLSCAMLLRQVRRQVFILNDPNGILMNPEKILPIDCCQSYVPKTALTSNPQEAYAFATSHARVIMKPLYAYQGNDVFLTESADCNFFAIFHLLREKYQAPVIVQEFLEGAQDLRVLMLGGKPMASYSRIPKEQSYIASVAAGARCVKLEIDAVSHQICDAVGDLLKQQGLHFVALDIMDGHLIEVNTTSPTGLSAVNALDGICYQKRILDYCESHM